MAGQGESENSRYLRSTISNLAFLGFLAYAIHQKVFTETSLMTIVTLFLGGYFGVRAVQSHSETVQRLGTGGSLPRMEAVRPPPGGPGDPPAGGGGDVHTRPTTEVEAQRGSKTPDGRYKWPGNLREYLPIALAMLGLLIVLAFTVMENTFVVIAKAKGIL